MAEKKKTFWNTPIPETIMNLVRPVWRSVTGGREPQIRSERGTRRLLVVLAVVSVALIWILEGFVNPVEYLVDLPIFDFNEMQQQYPDHYAFYFYWVLIMVALLMTLVRCLVRNDKEYPIWTLNGVLYWVVGLAMGILADVITRNIFMEQIVVPGLESWTTSMDAYKTVIGMLILLLFSFYFVLGDFSETAISVMITPFAMELYERFVPGNGILHIVLIEYLIITLVMKLVLHVMEMRGVISSFANLFVKYCYTPKYMPFAMLYIFVLPFLPILLIWYFIRGKKKEPHS